MKILRTLKKWFKGENYDQEWQEFCERWAKGQKILAQKVMNSIIGKNNYEKYMKRTEEYIKQDIDLRCVLDAEFANIYKELDALKNLEPLQRETQADKKARK